MTDAHRILEILTSAGEEVPMEQNEIEFDELQIEIVADDSEIADHPIIGNN